MDDARILTAFREELIAAGLVRRPTEAGPAVGPPYPMRIESAEGAAAPGELGDGEHDHDELVITLTLDGDVAPVNNYDANTRRRAVLNLAYRSAGNTALQKAMALDAAITARLISPATNYGYGFNLGTVAAIFAHEAGVFGGFGPVSRGRGVAFHHAAKYLVETTR